MYQAFARPGRKADADTGRNPDRVLDAATRPLRKHRCEAGHYRGDAGKLRAAQPQIAAVGFIYESPWQWIGKGP